MRDGGLAPLRYGMSVGLRLDESGAQMRDGGLAPLRYGLSVEWDMTSSLLEDAIRAREEGRYADAHALLLALLAENPDDPSVNYQMAWLHDAQGLERGAVPFYEKALLGDLTEEELRGALLGLGSTLRSLGEYEYAVEVLQRGMERFPEAGEFPAFLAMALYNTGKFRDAVALLLGELARSSGDAGIQRYRRAILFYHDKLDQTWDEEPE